MIFLYNFLLLFFFFLFSPFILAKLITTRRHRIGLRGRLGCLPSEILKSFAGKRPIWVHAVSVGELVAARPFLEILQKNYSCPILLSTTTQAGHNIAEKLFPHLSLLFFPFDFPLIVKKFVRLVRPKIFIAVESEIWPNLLNILKKRKIPAVLINGRLSERSYSHYRSLRFFNKRLFGRFTRLGMRSEREVKHIINLGAKKENVFVTGNLKYDAAISFQENLINEATTTSPVVARFIEVKDSPVIIFGSIHLEEEEEIVRHCARLRNSALLIFAPRHPEKSKLKTLFKRKNIRYTLWSKVCRHPNPGDALPQVGREREKILILDTIGELNSFYSIATLVFIGGTFIPWGGHNILEPAVFKKPVLFGPHMENFPEEAIALKTSGGAIEVRDAANLYATLSALLADPEKAKRMGEASFQAVKGRSGATEKNLELIKGLI